ncbi:MAG: hypothetical protein H0X66_13985 [Verrucomicrobia bacterium]|nr:hypothetical protein [Verrucomicrobiota bacterium]
MNPQITDDTILKAFSPGKQEWKSNGNYFTSAELQEMDLVADVVVFVPAETVLSAD